MYISNCNVHKHTSSHKKDVARKPDHILCGLLSKTRTQGKNTVPEINRTVSTYKPYYFQSEGF